MNVFSSKAQTKYELFTFMNIISHLHLPFEVNNFSFCRILIKLFVLRKAMYLVNWKQFDKSSHTRKWDNVLCDCWVVFSSIQLSRLFLLSCVCCCCHSTPLTMTKDYLFTCLTIRENKLLPLLFYYDTQTSWLIYLLSIDLSKSWKEKLVRSFKQSKKRFIAFSCSFRSLFSHRLITKLVSSIFTPTFWALPGFIPSCSRTLMDVG